MSNRKQTRYQRPLPTDLTGRPVEVLGDLDEAGASDPNALEKNEIRAPRSVGELDTERFIWLLHTR